ncbi:LAMI_0G11518g1_1 [Lachancea mirantina]|uniref:aminodeoxychorismate synthase n=1 Tax=Lachancea mirantina TaxID=1230905 RepID=A0A1G4KAZ3_9SACH|nr:LAMI_0G11518g1_1 [Lachancea mirantina]
MGFNVLFIDSYDSFTYNLVNLIQAQNEDIRITVIHNDTFGKFEDLKKYLVAFHCIVVGPGPGNPNNGVSDIGLLVDMFNGELDVPVLGICLGFQIMCRAAGARIEQLHEIKHGQVYDINLRKNAGQLFEEYPESFKSVRYHSLHAVGATEKLIPLCETQDENGHVLMGAQYAGKPFYGVQYHPESCCSELGGQLIRNFLKLANKYNAQCRSRSALLPDGSNKIKEILSLLDKKIDKRSLYRKQELHEKPIFVEELKAEVKAEVHVVCDRLKRHFFLMTSAVTDSERGKWSIIALPDAKSTVFTYFEQLQQTVVHHWRDKDVSPEAFEKAVLFENPIRGLQRYHEDKRQFWCRIGGFMQERMIANNPELPFIGGLVGILGYEMGQYTRNKDTAKLRPDAKLVYIENCVLFNHFENTWHLISQKNDFPEDVRQVIAEAVDRCEETRPTFDELPAGITYDIKLPTYEAYAEAFEKSQKYLHNGDSYEVCLTTQTTVKPSKPVKPWRIFQSLAERNPAPFASFFDFSDLSEEYNSVCFISSSPERFIKWSRDDCELRPIKGTVSKNVYSTLEEAALVLKTPKEFGENLMILDLIRNDLYQLLDDVVVDALMSIEEYKTVYQLVSVVKGRGLRLSKFSGIDLLVHSLPAGSMTGAPKKITVELLQQEIESDLNKHINSAGVRGLYSGVTGYLSCNDNADWSVNIRCLYSYDNAKTWNLGAGGAITVLSTLEGEWDEMRTKLESALQIFLD